ncbi:MAG: ATP-binding cassette domain-containing protein [Verrucomicrobiota bacterium]|nr:ATP-binding cassette domain-containing protein [Verrucomicrobiota bacterium]
MIKPLIQIENLCVRYRTRHGMFTAVDGVSFNVKKGLATGLIGESGSGKTTVGKAILRLVPIASGSICYEGVDLATLSPAEFFPWRKRVQMIFQDPFLSLNPRATVAEIVEEPLLIHFPALTRAERNERIAALLKSVGLAPEHAVRYPAAFSGGQRQRIGIARALAVEPELLICDEPVSALDVSVQAQILNLLQELQERLGLSLLFIAHDLAVVEHVCDHVIVMQQGKLVEEAAAEVLYRHPQHAYTRQLLAAVPVF